MGNSRPPHFLRTTFRKFLFVPCRPAARCTSQTSSMKPFFSPTLLLYRHKHAPWKKLTYKYLHTQRQKNKIKSVRTHTYTTHTHAHLFEDPTNLSNSALGKLLMGDRGRGWWKCLRPGRIDRLAAPNERQACLRNHEGRAVGLQQRS